MKKIIGENGRVSYTIVLERQDIKKDAHPDFFFDNLVIFKTKKRIDGMYVIRYEPTKKWHDNSRDFMDYTGKITFYTVEGEKINSIKLVDGGMDKDKDKGEYYKASCELKLESESTLCTELIDANGDSTGVKCETTYEYKWKCTSGGGDGFDNNNDPLEPGGLPRTGGNWTPPTLPEEEEVAVKISIDPKLAQDYPCFAQQVQQAYKLCSDLNIDFLEYFESSEDFNVVYSYEDLEGTASANTFNDLNCTLPCTTEINFNQDYMGTMSGLGIAANTIHENTHAMLFYLWKTGEINISNPTYKNLAQGYADVLASDNPEHDGTLSSLKELGHEHMVGLIDKLAGTLYNYASSRGINVDMEYCRKMMWGGTFSTLDSYEKEFTPDERKEISAIVNAELNNKSYTYQLSDGSIQTTTAKGQAITSNSCD